MIRELGLGNSRAFKSDIDIVSLSTRGEIYNAIKQYSPQLNKFGGYRFLVGTQLFDIWSFEDTWAFKAGLVKGSATHDIFKTTFFNLDAAAFHVKPRRFACSDTYIEALKLRLLDLNLQENPSPSGMVRRAIRMAIENELLITRRLGEYILENLQGSDFDSFGTPFVRALDRYMCSENSGHFSFEPQRCLFDAANKSEAVKVRTHRGLLAA